ncbi:MAG: HipA domain-containing protein, partial [Solimonas sp.]
GNHRDYPWATVVEHLSLAAAAACGLPVPGNQLSADGRLLAVERFDVRGGTVLGFDEACPLLGLLSAEKYDGSYERMCRQLLRFVAPAARAETAQALLKQLTLCYAIENGDAHLKNFGLLYDEPADARLSPVYDVLTTTCFATMQRDRPALTLGGRKVWDAYGELEQLFGRTLLLPRPTIRTIFGEVLDGVRATLPRFIEMRERFPQAAETLRLAEQAWQRGMERLAAQLAR